jgi:hypothetical protein
MLFGSTFFIITSHFSGKLFSISSVIVIHIQLVTITPH